MLVVLLFVKILIWMFLYSVVNLGLLSSKCISMWSGDSLGLFIWLWFGE